MSNLDFGGNMFSWDSCKSIFLHFTNDTRYVGGTLHNFRDRSSAEISDQQGIYNFSDSWVIFFSDR